MEWKEPSKRNPQSFLIQLCVTYKSATFIILKIIITFINFTSLASISD